ncbi:MAG: DegT/DnrJ/EryC1/StrS aminotransferase family protein [Vicinamibacterales bacterium]
MAFAPPSIGEPEIDEVVAVLKSGWLTTGARVHAFEEAFAAYVGAPHAVALNSCTAALHLSLLAARVGPGDEVITTPLTFCATANTVIHTGATPIFVDVDPRTGNIDPTRIEAAITARTKAILPVHYAGRPVDAAAIGTIAQRHGLTVIDDAAHAVEARSTVGKVGATADFTCFSFYATKNLTTGEGGMVTLRSKPQADWIRIASLHGLSRDAWARYTPSGRADYDVVMPGFKYNMMDIQAALGLHQLARIELNLARRNAIWQRYEAGLAHTALQLPAPVECGTRHARHLFTVLADRDTCGISRNDLQRALQARGIVTSVHFRALHLHPYYAERFGLQRGMFPHAEFVSDRTLSLPLSPALTDAEIDRVVDAVLTVVPGRAC